MRKIISFVLAAVLAVGVLSNAPICKLQLVASAGNVSLDSVTFRLNGDGKSYRVYKCQESAEGDLTIPSTYNGLPVKDIYQNAFSSCKKISSVTLPESIGTIGAFAFSNCKSLTSVIIPNGVEVISGFAFDNCSSLASITLPDSLTQIDLYAFSGSAYYNDESNWENDVLYIGNHLIEAKTTVSGVYNIKNGTKTIGESAFSGCSGLTSVKIPSSVKNIGENAFYNTGIYNTESNWENGVLYIDDCLIKAKSTSDSYQTKVGTRIIADDAFDNCTNLRSVVISGSVTNIGNECFSGHSKLINVTIAGGVKEIGRKAFYYCRNLTVVTIPQTVTKIDDFAFGYLDVTELSKVGGFKISGHVGSTAEKYATENGFEFVELKSNHTPSAWITDKSATCTEDGTKHKECTVCGDTVETGIITKSGHSPSDWITDKSATCTEDGTKHKECTKCGDTLETGTITKSGHSPSDWITDKSATCTEDGIKHRACTKCGDTLETGIITKSGHSPSEWITDKSATCTEDGTKHKVCTRCGDTLETGTIAKLGHTSSNWIVDKKATVNSAGSQHKECTVCGKNLETATIPQLTPGTPKLNSVSNSSSGVTVKWSKVSGADSYIVYRKSGSSGWKAIKSGLTGTSYTDTTAKSGTKYTYTVRGVNEAGFGTYNTTGKSITYLAMPKLSSVANSTSGVTVKWSKVTGAKEYYVYRKSGNGGWKKIGTSTGTSYTDKTAKSGTSYTYTVRAYNGKTSSSYNTKGLTIKFLATPKLSSVTSAKSGVTFKWGKVTGASGYYVYRKTGNGGWQKIATVKGNSKVSYLDKSAKKGTTYTYTVRAYSGKTMSAYNTKGLKIKDKY